MQPLSPRVRAALKAEHPGLTDEVIDQVEGLILRRTDLDPVGSPENALAIRSLETQRERLIADHMPRFADVLRRVRADRLSDDWPSLGPGPAPRPAASPPPSPPPAPRAPGKRSGR